TGAWMQSRDRRHYDSIVFAPGTNNPRQYNMWRGFSVEPKEGDVSLFWDFMQDVICDGDASLFQYVKAFFAHMVQRPWELPEVALVLQGDQGTGKSYFVKQMGELLADHFLHVMQRRHV